MQKKRKGKRLMDFTERLSAQIKGSPFYCRPLALLSAAFLVSLFLFKLKPLLFIIFLVGALIYSVFLLISGRKALGLKNPLPFLLIFSVLLSPLVSLTQVLEQNRLKDYIGESTEVKVTVEKTYYSESFGSMHLVKLNEISGRKASGRAYLDITLQMEFQPYDTLTLTAQVGDALKDMGTVERLSRISGNICLTLVSDTVIHVTDESKRGFVYTMYKARESMGGYLRECLDPYAADYAIALFVGDTSPLPMSFKRDMSALGISHILAVSGMHTSMIAAMVGFALNRTRSGRKTKAIFVSLAGLAFMCIAGLSPCVVRTVIMLILSVTPCFFGRRGDSITALMLSAVIICIVSPSSVLSCSLLLSFFATLGIVLSASFISKRARSDLYKSRSGDMKRIYKILRPLVLSIIVSLSASVFTIPVIALYYGKVSFIAVIANLVAVPCSDYSMILLVAVFFTGKFPFIGRVSTFLFEALYRFLVIFSELMTKSFETTVSVRYPFFAVILVFFLSAMLYLRLRGIRNPASPIASFLLCAVIFTTGVQIYSAAVSDRGEVIYALDNGSEALLVTDGTKSMYIDIGNGSKSLPLSTLTVTERLYYETSLEAYMFTHYHSSHIGTLKYILSGSYVKRLYLPEPETEKELSFYNSIVKLAEGECEIVKFVRGDAVSFGNTRIETLPYTLLERSTHPPLAVKVTANNRSLVWLGSSVMESSEAFFLSEMLADCKTVIVGRHGPKTKESFPIFIPEGTDIYLSPLEDTDEHSVFSGEVSFIYLDSQLAFFELDEPSTRKK